MPMRKKQKTFYMLHGYVMLYHMARGESGRIVVEIDPSEKEDLYAALTKDGLTLKHWFLRRATEYLRERQQGLLFSADALAESKVPYRVGGAGEGRRREKTKEKMGGR